MLKTFTTFAAAALVATSLSAQACNESLTSVNPFASNNGGSVGGAVYFTIDVTAANGVRICDLALNTSVTAGNAISGFVYRNLNYTDVTQMATGGPELDASNWCALSTMSGTSAGQDQPSQMTLSSTIDLPQGQHLMAVFGSFNHRYTNGDPTTNTAVGNGMTFIGGKASNTPFSGTVFSGSLTTPYRIMNVTFNYFVPALPVALSSCGTPSSVSSVGTGCDGAGGSWYEAQIAGGDLNGVTITGTPNGAGGIDVTTGPGAVPSPGPGATAVVLGDDDQQPAGGTLGIYVGSNGIVSLGAGNTTGFSPSVSTMLGDPSPGFYTWLDLQPDAAGSGQVWYEESGTVATVIFDGVFEWGTTTPFFAQFVIDTATGGYAVTIGSTPGSDYLCAYGTAGASIDTGGVDVSAGGFSHTSADVPNLALSSNAPVLGGNWTLQTDHIQTGPFSVFFFGDTLLDPAVDLTSIGADGCFAHTNANLTSLLGSVPAGGSSSLTIALPVDPAIAGAQFTIQSTAASNNLSSGFSTSNGITATIGDF
jgi:hypothetical protein